MPHNERQGRAIDLALRCTNALPPPCPAGLKEGQQQEPEILLGHYCAILTSLSLSAGGRLLATTDRCGLAGRLQPVRLARQALPLAASQPQERLVLAACKRAVLA